MIDDGNNPKNEGEESSLGGRFAFDRGESFFEYIERSCDLGPERVLGKRLSRIGEAIDLEQLVEYMKWKSGKASSFRRSYPLISTIHNVWLAKGEHVYHCDSWIDRQKGVCEIKPWPTAGRILRVGIEASADMSHHRLGDLSRFLTDCIVADLERQILVGNGSDTELKGLLLQAETIEIKERRGKLRLDAIEEFCQRKEGEPSALIMSPGAKLRLMRASNNIGGNADVVKLKTILSSFVGPIMASGFMPDEHTVLAIDFEKTIAFSERRISLAMTRLKNGDVQIIVTYWSNVAIKDKARPLKIVLPDNYS